MARTSSGLIRGAVAGLALGMASGFLVATVVISDLAPVKAWRPGATRTAPAFVDDNWPPPRYDDPLGTRTVRADGR